MLCSQHTDSNYFTACSHSHSHKLFAKNKNVTIRAVSLHLGSIWYRIWSAYCRKKTFWNSYWTSFSSYVTHRRREHSLEISQWTPRLPQWTPSGSLWHQCVEIGSGSCVILIQHHTFGGWRSAWLSCSLIARIKVTSDQVPECRKCEILIFKVAGLVATS